ncbi:MAG: hypothetical protein EP347_10255 [Alphaproteobacteria bacterium]|nr:MAG: hypothetical protein EP347_10255 [Alphaproteobacteria bacterium]
MQAINHLATALVVKKSIPQAPLLPLLLATEAIEFIWVGLNLVGVEYVTLDAPGTHITDMHLTHMPFSHSLLGAAICALLLALAALWRQGVVRIALALGVAVFSHILLDLAVHEPDIALAPFVGGAKYGTDFIATFPFTELLVETIYGLICWRIFGGSRALLAVFMLSFAIAAPSYLPRDWGLSAPVDAANFPILILIQILVTLALVFYFARTTATRHM